MSRYHLYSDPQLNNNRHRWRANHCLSQFMVSALSGPRLDGFAPLRRPPCPRLPLAVTADPVRASTPVPMMLINVLPRQGWSSSYADILVFLTSLTTPRRLRPALSELSTFYCYSVIPPRVICTPTAAVRIYKQSVHATVFSTDHRPLTCYLVPDSV